MSDEQRNEQLGLWHWLKAFLMLAAIALGWFILARTGMVREFGEYGWVRERVEEFGLYGPLLFILFFGLSTVIGIPRLLVSAVAGFVFDLGPAIAIALCATMVGCITSFFYARLMGRAIIRDMMSLRIRNLEKLLIEHGFIAGIAIRALPVSNNTIVNLLAGVTGVKPLHYFAGSAIGYLPLTVVFVLAGSGAQQDVFGRLLLSLGLYLFVVIPIGYFVQRKIRSLSAEPANPRGNTGETR